MAESFLLTPILHNIVTTPYHEHIPWRIHWWVNIYFLNHGGTNDNRGQNRKFKSLNSRLETRTSDRGQLGHRPLFWYIVPFGCLVACIFTHIIYSCTFVHHLEGISMKLSSSTTNWRCAGTVNLTKLRSNGTIQLIGSCWAPIKFTLHCTTRRASCWFPSGKRLKLCKLLQRHGCLV